MKVISPFQESFLDAGKEFWKLSVMVASPSLQPSIISEFSVSVFTDQGELGRAAAERSASIIEAAIARRGIARLLLATGNSQLSLMNHLAGMDLDWAKVESFHLDEYVGLRADHPASFRRWIRTRFTERVMAGTVHYLNGEAKNPDAEARRYGKMIVSKPLDLAFVGFGENGHIAFNDPHVANFDDPLIVKRVALDKLSRHQQVNEGHFPDIDSVPREALSVTCTGLRHAENWVCSVPELRKAKAVKKALEGPITTNCPASFSRVHPRVYIYLDTESSSLLRGRQWLTAQS